MDSSFEKLVEGIDVAFLLQNISNNPQLFNELTARQDVPGTPHQDTQSIFLRWAASSSIHAAFNELSSVNYPALTLLPEAQDLIDRIFIETESIELGRALIVSLKPGGFIDPHADEGSYADHFERFHLCLKSDEGNLFFSEHEPGHGEYVHMQAGELWAFNHKRKHWLVNNSDSERIHLIVDCVSPKYRKERAA
jgi:hypothetical protein